VRTPDEDDNGDRKRALKKIWGNEATLVVSGDVGHSEDEVPLPALVVGMAVLHRPAREPGANAVRALNNVRGRDHPAGYLAGDRAYTSAKAEDYQLPTKALGYRHVHDYKITQLGVQAEARGLIQVEGNWYCPSMPEKLILATKDFRTGTIDEATYRRRLEARVPYRARPKGLPDADGYQQFVCPASTGSPTARCPLKPKSVIFDGMTRVHIRPTQTLRDHQPDVCRQQTIMVSPEAGAKLSQTLVFGSPEHQRVYATLRNSIEGMNGYVKDGAREALGDPARRRIRGVAAQSVLVVFQLMAANLRKINGYLTRRAKASLFQRPRPRRRRTKSIETWRPQATNRMHGGPSPPEG